jgi:hypothetical protein
MTVPSPTLTGRVAVGVRRVWYSWFGLQGPYLRAKRLHGCKIVGHQWPRRVPPRPFLGGMEEQRIMNCTRCYYIWPLAAGEPPRRGKG